MNKLEQRIAIAETQGWTCINATGLVPVGFSPELSGPAVARVDKLPDYLNDRNAMIAAVLELSAPERIRFVKRLAENIGVDFYDDLLGIDETSVFMCVTAPLDKIAKAYLVAKSKWHND